MLHSCCSIFTRCQTHPIKRGRRQRTLTVLMLRAWFTTQRHTDEKLFTPFIPQNSSFLSRLLLLLLVSFLSKVLWQSCYPLMHYFNLGLSKQLTANSLLTLAKTEISLVIYIPWTLLLHWVLKCVIRLCVSQHDAVCYVDEEGLTYYEVNVWCWNVFLNGLKYMVQGDMKYSDSDSEVSILPLKLNISPV